MLLSRGRRSSRVKETSRSRPPLLPGNAKAQEEIVAAVQSAMPAHQRFGNWLAARLMNSIYN
jgi:hypothetical protein